MPLSWPTSALIASSRGAAVWRSSSTRPVASCRTDDEAPWTTVTAPRSKPSTFASWHPYHGVGKVCVACTQRASSSSNAAPSGGRRGTSRRWAICCIRSTERLVTGTRCPMRCSWKLCSTGALIEQLSRCHPRRGPPAFQLNPLARDENGEATVSIASNPNPRRVRQGRLIDFLDVLNATNDAKRDLVDVIMNSDFWFHRADGEFGDASSVVVRQTRTGRRGNRSFAGPSRTACCRQIRGGAARALSALINRG